MKISILGLGWFGAPLGLLLKEAGHSILGSTREEEKRCALISEGINAFVMNPPTLPPPECLDSDIIILNIPPFEGQLEWFKSWPWKKSSWIIFISSTSLYAGPLGENSRILHEEEKWIMSTFKDWSILRFGGLLGGDRHPGNHLSGKKNLKGRLWPVNLLHLDDAIGFTKVVIEKKLKHEVLHVVCDRHPTREEYYTQYCEKKGLSKPEFDQEDGSQKEAIVDTSANQHYSCKLLP